MSVGLINLYNAVLREIYNLTTTNDPLDKYSTWDPLALVATKGQAGAITNASKYDSASLTTKVFVCINFTYTWDGVSDKKIIHLGSLPIAAAGAGTSIIYRSAGLVADTSVSPINLLMTQVQINPNIDPLEIILNASEDFVEGHDYVIKAEIHYTHIVL